MILKRDEAGQASGTKLGPDPKSHGIFYFVMGPI